MLFIQTSTSTDNKEYLKLAAHTSVKKSRALTETPCQSCGLSLATWDHAECYLPPDTSDPTVTKASGETGTRLNYPSGGMEG